MAAEYTTMIFAGSGALTQDRVSLDLIEAQLGTWFRQQRAGARLITKITIDFHNGPAALITLKPEKEATYGPA